MKAFYFGCVREAGHFWWDQWLSMSGRNIGELGGLLIDGVYAPSGPEVEGPAQVVYLNLNHKSWTLIAFWDRSVDKRGKCNSAFLIEGTHVFNEALRFAKSIFPSIMERFAFQITEWKPE